MNRYIERAIKLHAKKNPFIECCGLIVNTGAGQFYIECENVHEDKKNHFKISDKDYISVSSMGEIVAVVHSHVGKNANETLSKNDRIMQYLNPITWVLCSRGKVSVHEPIKKLKGREFKEGYCDCYDSFKDFYKLAGKDMGEYSPEDGFRIPDWHKVEGAESPFLQFMGKEGFSEVEKIESIEPGDVILSLLGAPIPNHASTYIGDNEIFHHLPGRPSAIEPLRRYFIDFKHSIWRADDRASLQILDVIAILKSERFV